jgi:hypothetical protein
MRAELVVPVRLLTRFAPARLVEDELTDLDRLGVLRGPTGVAFR